MKRVDGRNGLNSDLALLANDENAVLDTHTDSNSDTHTEPSAFQLYGQLEDYFNKLHIENWQSAVIIISASITEWTFTKPSS